LRRKKNGKNFFLKKKEEFFTEGIFIDNSKKPFFAVQRHFWEKFYAFSFFPNQMAF